MLAKPTRQVNMLNLAKAALVGLAAAVLLAACDHAPDDQKPTGAASTATTEDTSAAAQFAAVTTPTRRHAEIYGSYTRGCIAGAEHLPENAPHWQVLNPSRNRSWAHPMMIDFIHQLADQMAKDGFGGLLVGDIAQPRGGPLPSDHNSHQVGLDADIWLTPLPATRLTASELESYEPPLMVDLATLTANALFGPAQYAMLKHAAQSPDVERIFVSPPLKRALCERTPVAERDWLRKIRPWRGHMEHMHVRLACPAGSDDCKAQDAPPVGDGCGAELSSWFDNTAWSRQAPTKYVPEKAMRLDGLPKQCRSLLSERG